MAASSPASVTPSRAVATTVGRPAAEGGPATPPGPGSGLAPSITLPLRFILTGMVSLLGGLGLLCARPDLLTGYHYNQYVIAVTHLFVLGFITTVVMGAMYQLVPVALETRLFSERLARWQFAFHVCGFVGMVAMFWIWDLKQVGHFGSVLAVGVAMFAYNLGRTLWRVPRWTVVATGIASALVWLCLTVFMGLLVAAGKCTYESVEEMTPAGPLWMALKALQATARGINRFDAVGVMHAHAHLGVVGFFVMMIISVSYKLLPMFLLSDLQSERRARASIWLLNLALVGLFFTIALRSPWKWLPAVMGAAAVGAYAGEIVSILRARRRRTIDWGLRYFLTAVGLLLAVALLGVGLSWPGLAVTEFTSQLETVYGFVGIVGVVTFTIFGFLYKIVPFLVWYHRYSREVGRHRVPSLADLYSERLQIVGYWLFLGGLALSVSGALSGRELLARLGGLGLLASLAVFGANLAGMLRHLVRPQLASLSSPLKPTSQTP